MNNKTVLITGGARGMGRVTALALAEKGANVILVDWEGEWGKRTADEINAKKHGAARFIYCDLSSITQVKALSEQLLSELDSLDVLYCNAGITYPLRSLSEDGHEMHFAICHLAHFQLANRLLPLLEKADQGRVIVVSSDGHKACPEINFGDLSNAAHWKGKAIDHAAAFRAYSHAKLCNLLFMKELAERLEARASSVSVNAVSPGYFVNTGIHREMQGIFGFGSWLVFSFGSLFNLNTPEKGARSHIWLANCDGGKSSGEYYEHCKPKAMSDAANDKEAQKKLWRVSEVLTQTRIEN